MHLFRQKFETQYGKNLLLVALLAVVIAACGFKGPLFIPPKPIAAPTPASKVNAYNNTPVSDNMSESEVKQSADKH